MTTEVISDIRNVKYPMVCGRGGDGTRQRPMRLKWHIDSGRKNTAVRGQMFAGSFTEHFEDLVFILRIMGEPSLLKEEE